MNLIDMVRDEQVSAGEDAVLRSLKLKGLLDEKMEEALNEKVKNLFPLGDQATSEQYKYRASSEVGKKLHEKAKEMSEEDRLKLLGAVGNRFNQGKLQWHLVDFRALEPMVKVLMYGANKYAPDQWKNGLSLKDTLDSLHRHTFALQHGETVDPESGEPHIGHALCNLLFYSYLTTVDSAKARP